MQILIMGEGGGWREEGNEVKTNSLSVEFLTYNNNIQMLQNPIFML